MLTWYDTDKAMGAAIRASDEPLISILYPCNMTFGDYELYIPSRLSDVERFDTMEEAKARAEEIMGDK